MFTVQKNLKRFILVAGIFNFLSLFMNFFSIFYRNNYITDFELRLGSLSTLCLSSIFIILIGLENQKFLLELNSLYLKLKKRNIRLLKLNKETKINVLSLLRFKNSNKNKNKIAKIKVNYLKLIKNLFKTYYKNLFKNFYFAKNY